MALDPNIFFQGAELKARRQAQADSTVSNFFDKMMAEKNRKAQEEKARSTDYEGAAMRVLTAQAQGTAPDPRDIPMAQAYGKFQSMQNAIDPTTGNIYPKNRNIFEALGTAPSSATYKSPYEPENYGINPAGGTMPPQGINPNAAMPPMPKGNGMAINDLGGDLVMPPVGDNYGQVSQASPMQRDMARGVTAPMGASPKTMQKAEEVNLDLQKESAIEKLKQQTATEIEQAKNNKLDLNTLPILESMLQYNKGTINAPYAGSAPVEFGTRMLNPQAATNMDLLKQNRLELAAPLAKQLGVNPTDKDFQATLNRIFDENASKESRDAQINNLIRRVKIRQGLDTGNIQNTGNQSNTVNWSDLK